MFAGLLLARPSLIGVPFFIAGTLKIAYDLVLFRAFRAIAPSGEVTRVVVIASMLLGGILDGRATCGRSV